MLLLGRKFSTKSQDLKIIVCTIPYTLLQNFISRYFVLNVTHNPFTLECKFHNEDQDKN